MRSWNSSVSGVREASARSTYVSPRTSRRTCMPLFFSSAMSSPPWRSETEEHGLCLPLEADVELEDVALCARDQRVPSCLIDPLQHAIGAIRHIFVRKVQ